MRLEIITLTLDAMPWLAVQFANYQQLKCDWRVWIIEGAAMNVHCTKWCQPQEPRLSRDGTSEFVQGIRSHPRVRVIQKQKWDGKLEMVNAPLGLITQPCVLLQADADEVWSPESIARLLGIFQTCSDYDVLQVRCRYFLGPNIIATGSNAYGNKAGEWVRAWRFVPGMRFVSHEPPAMTRPGTPWVMKTANTGDQPMFDHYAWVLPKQVRFKMDFYGYPHALEHWQRLQRNTAWPIRDLSRWLPWVGPNATADLLHKL